MSSWSPNRIFGVQLAREGISNGLARMRCLSRMIGTSFASARPLLDAQSFFVLPNQWCSQRDSIQSRTRNCMTYEGNDHLIGRFPHHSFRATSIRDVDDDADVGKRWYACANG